MELFLLTIRFSENFIHEVKEPSHFSMLESKLWHSETENKNVKGLKIVGCFLWSTSEKNVFIKKMYYIS